MRRFLPFVLAALALVLVLVIGAASCLCSRCTSDDVAPAASGSGSTAVASAAPSASVSATATAEPDAPTAAEIESWKQCALRREALAKEPELPGSPGFEERRVHLARVRGRAVLWRRVPEAASDRLETRLGKNDSPLATVRGLLRDNKRREARREIFLREGYLYEDRVDVALAMVETIGLTDLFDEPTLYLARGAVVYELERLERTRYLPERYAYKNGALAGEVGEILLGDRVSTERAAVEQGSLVVDLVDLQRRSDFDRIKVTRLTEKAMLADVRYGPDFWVPAVVALDGAKAEVACEVLDAETLARKRAFVEARHIERRAMRRIRQVIRAAVREKIPFDAAPDNEDGFLRRAWTRAYFNGWRRFTFRDKKSDVYNEDGKPIPPQVCIDFIVDTWERAAGSWYAPMVGDPPKPVPGREPGPIHMAGMDLKNLRSVNSFVKFAKRHSDIFDVWDLPKEERIRFQKRGPFFDYLASHADSFRVGDVLILYGTKHGGRPHYHSLIVIEVDPITGVPTRVAGNAVFPREQTLEGIMQISPRRTIRHRIRLLRPWLELIAAQAPPGEEPVDEGLATDGQEEPASAAAARAAAAAASGSASAPPDDPKDDAEQEPEP